MTRSAGKRSDWYTTARQAQTDWKLTSATLPDAARKPGTCFIEEHGKRVEVGPFPICLPVAFADLNLLPSVRTAAIERFRRLGIEWHGWSPGPADCTWPSSHLLDSQVQCVNVLLTLATGPGCLLDLVRQVEPDATDLLCIEDGSPVTFEWIGMGDYLGEARGRPRHRGRFCTSADALVVAQRPEGRTAVLIEWKFTEMYTHAVSPQGPGGRDRREVYKSAFEAATCPLSGRPPIDAFLQEPHYQLFRQALLAAGMVEAGEHGIDRAVLLDVVPAQNTDLRAITTPGLRAFGSDMDAIWRRLLSGPRVIYRCLDSSPLLGSTPELAERYGMLCG